MSAKPLWLRAVHRLERAVGEPVEAAVRTETYFDLMTKATRTTKSVKRKVAGTSTRALHLLNLPAGTDMQRMREQLARMERRINQLSETRRGAATDAMPPTLNPVDLVSRINRDVERSLLRARNGVRYVRGTHAPQARRDAQGGRVAARQGRAVALPQRHGPVRPAGADRAQPRQPQLHPRPAARQQPRRVPHRRRAWTCSCSTGACRTSSTPTTTSSATSTATCRAPSRPCSARAAATR